LSVPAAVAVAAAAVVVVAAAAAAVTAAVAAFGRFLDVFFGLIDEVGQRLVKAAGGEEGAKGNRGQAHGGSEAAESRAPR
jgi:hypothetical protein